MSKKVLAIYFETKGINKDSVSSIGIALYENKKIILNKELPINLNVDERAISYFPRILSELTSLIDENTLVISPNATYDISVLRNACDKYEIEYPIFNYLCTWKLDQIIYGEEEEYLEDLEIDTKTPKEEALACINEYVRILENSSYDNIDNLLSKYYIEKGKLLKDSYSPFGMRRMENPLYRKNIVFTGGLSCMRRAEAFNKVKSVGGIPSNSVSKYTHYLVIGDQGVRRFSTRGKSSKMISAERLVSQGYNLKIISEDEFLKMI